MSLPVPDISIEHRSPNIGDPITEVRAVIIHGTMLDLPTSLSRLTDPAAQVSCHYVIALDGTVFELIPGCTPMPRSAWHAGVSRLMLDGEVLTGLNRCSIGIELENLNGNLFDYSPAQYSALMQLIGRLQAVHPRLTDPQTIIGHEQVSGFRGKCDPGRCFDWQQLFTRLFPGIAVYPERPPILPEEQTALFETFRTALIRHPEISGPLAILMENYCRQSSAV